MCRQFWIILVDFNPSIYVYNYPYFCSFNTQLMVTHCSPTKVWPFFSMGKYRGFIKISCTETLHRDLLRSCQEAPYRDLAKRPLIEILYRDLARTPLMENLYRDIAWRSVAEILPRGLLHKSCQASFYRELVPRSHTEILPRDLL